MNNPVAWMDGRGNLFKHPDDAERGQTMQPLYRKKQQLSPMTEKNIVDLWGSWMIPYARMLEEAHKIK
jgi:hypothetical protein